MDSVNNRSQDIGLWSSLLPSQNREEAKELIHLNKNIASSLEQECEAIARTRALIVSLHPELRANFDQHISKLKEIVRQVSINETKIGSLSISIAQNANSNTVQSPAFTNTASTVSVGSPSSRASAGKKASGSYLRIMLQGVEHNNGKLDRLKINFYNELYYYQVISPTAVKFPPNCSRFNIYCSHLMPTARIEGIFNIDYKFHLLQVTYKDNSIVYLERSDKNAENSTPERIGASGNSSSSSSLTTSTTKSTEQVNKVGEKRTTGEGQNPNEAGPAKRLKKETVAID